MILFDTDASIAYFLNRTLIPIDENCEPNYQTLIIDFNEIKIDFSDSSEGLFVNLLDGVSKISKNICKLSSMIY